MLHNLQDLVWQFDYRGQNLTNLKIRVCKTCLDKPADQLRPVILPPDPVPVRDPRVENYSAEDQGISATQSVQPPGFGPLIAEN